MDFKFAESYSGKAHWLPRIAFAGVFLYHGLTKFPAAQGMSQAMGMPLPMIYLLATIETLAGALVLYGGTGKDWATRIGGLLIVPVMLGAIYLVHLPHGWNSIGNMGYEFQVLLAAMGLNFFLKGNK
ncbi:MAG: DoxX family protein [Candidatus Aenigmarchaeota archaeon]|nr:DoxX family protein [Candidatus Aenigmarchaeota archaeon]